MTNENQNTEFKRIWKDEYLKWVCGFANAQGGRIYIGTCCGATVDDIDPDAIHYFLKRAVREGRMSAESANSTPEEVIANLGLLEEGVPCNGAILLFGKYPQRKFVTSAFKIGRFGSTNFDLLSQEKVEGNLIQMPEGLSIEKLMGKHTSEPRNPKMAEAVYRAGFIEAWGRGIEKVVTGFKEEGLTPPTFAKEQGGVTVHIPREKFVAINLGGTIDVNGGSEKTDQKGSARIEPKPIQTDINRYKTDTKTDQKNTIIEIIRENPEISMDELSRCLSITKSSVQRRLEGLVREERIRHIGPKNGGLWEVLM